MRRGRVQTVVSLRPRSPFRLDATVWTLRRRPENAIDRWDGTTYSRTFALCDQTVNVTVRQTGTRLRPRLEIAVASSGPPSDVVPAVVGAVQRMLGTDVDLGDFYLLATNDPQLAPLVQRFKGVKPPRFPTLFEALVNAVACQQLSLTMGIRLLGRLAALAHGASADDAREPPFPRAERVAALRSASLRRAGFSRQKIAALRDIARAAVAGHLDLEQFSGLDDSQAVGRLRELRGIGRWSAEYVLLRGLGRCHVFPGDDIGARNNLQGWLGLRKSLDYESLHKIVRRWHPYAGLVYFHLLLRQLAESSSTIA